MTKQTRIPQPDPEMVEAVRVARDSAPTAFLNNPEIIAALINLRAAQLIIAKLDELLTRNPS